MWLNISLLPTKILSQNKASTAAGEVGVGTYKSNTLNGGTLDGCGREVVNEELRPSRYLCNNLVNRTNF